MQVGYGASNQVEKLLTELHSSRKAAEALQDRALKHMGDEDQTSKDLAKTQKVQALDKTYEVKVESKKEDRVELSGNPRGIGAFPEFQIYSNKKNIVHSVDDIMYKRRIEGKDHQLDKDMLPNKTEAANTLVIANPVPVKRNEVSHRLLETPVENHSNSNDIGTDQEYSLDQNSVQAQAEEKKEDMVEQIINEAINIDPAKLNSDPSQVSKKQEQYVVQVAAPVVSSPEGVKLGGGTATTTVTVTSEQNIKDPINFSSYIKQSKSSAAEGKLLGELGLLSRLNSHAVSRANLEEVKTEDNYENRKFFEMVQEQRRMLNAKLNSKRNISIFNASRDKHKLVDGTDNKFEIDVQTKFTTSWTEIMVNPAFNDKTGSKASTGEKDPNAIIQRPVHSFDFSQGFNKDVEQAQYQGTKTENKVNLQDNRRFTKDVLVAESHQEQKVEQKVSLSPKPFYSSKPKAVESFYSNKEASKANNLPEPYQYNGPEITTVYEMKTDPSIVAPGSKSKTLAAAQEYAAMTLKSAYQQEKVFNPKKSVPSVEVPRKVADGGMQMRIMPVQKLMDTPKIAVNNRQAQAAMFMQSNSRQEAKSQSAEARRSTKPVVKTSKKRADVQVNVSQIQKRPAAQQQKAATAYKSSEPVRKTVNNKAHAELAIKGSERRNASRVVDNKSSKNNAVSFVKQQTKTEFKSITFKKVNQAQVKNDTGSNKIPAFSTQTGGIRVRPLNVNIRPKMQTSISGAAAAAKNKSTD